MAGRPKKKPEYNPELQFNNFLQELRDAYEEAASLRSLADELNISLLGQCLAYTAMQTVRSCSQSYRQQMQMVKRLYRLLRHRIPYISKRLQLQADTVSMQPLIM